MPGPARTPVFVRRCVRAVARERGLDTSSAFAICVANAQKSGTLEPGTITATAAGKKLSKKKSSQDGAGDKAKDYEKLLAQSRAEARGRTMRVLLGEAEEADDIESQLDGDVTGELKVRLTAQVGTASAETQKAAMVLLKRYQMDWTGGYNGTSTWGIDRMRLRFKPITQVIEAEIWFDVFQYPGFKVLSDICELFSAAALELSQSMTSEGIETFLGDVTPDKVTAEPVEFVPSEG